MDTDKIWEDICEERERQLELNGPDGWQTPGDWIVIELEELGKVSKIVNDRLSDKELRTALISSAAVLVAWIEEMDSERTP